jgi:ketosteroid isomerase-like protein
MYDRGVMAGLSSAGYVTAVLHFLQAFNRNDLDACEQFLDPQVEWHGAVSYTGRAEVRSMLQSLSERFSRPQARPDEFREAGGQVLMIVCFSEADPEAEAPPPEQRQSWIVGLSEEGLMRRVTAYPSPADAARAFRAGRTGT